MKKSGIIFCVAALALCACAKKTVAEDFGNLLDTATAGLNSAAAELKSAKDAPAVTAVLTKTHSILLTLRTRGAEFEKKHGLTSKTQMPPELREKRRLFQAALANVFSPELKAVIKQYNSNPEIMAAIMKISALRSKPN